MIFEKERGGVQDQVFLGGSRGDIHMQCETGLDTFSGFAILLPISH
jgi:hypothetical protein